MSELNRQLEVLRVNGAALDVANRGVAQTIPLASSDRLDQIFIRITIDNPMETIIHTRFREGEAYVIRENPCTWLAIGRRNPDFERRRGKADQSEDEWIPDLLAGRGRIRLRNRLDRSIWWGSGSDKDEMTAGQTTRYRPAGGGSSAMCYGTPRGLMAFNGPNDSAKVAAEGHYAFMHGETVTVTFDGTAKLKFTLDDPGK